MVSASPSRSVTPVITTGLRSWLGGQIEANSACAPLQSGALLTTMFTVVVVEAHPSLALKVTGKVPVVPVAGVHEKSTLVGLPLGTTGGLSEASDGTPEVE